MSPKRKASKKRPAELKTRGTDDNDATAGIGTHIMMSFGFEPSTEQSKDSTYEFTNKTSEGSK